MDNVAVASINTFGPSLKADFVPTTEEPIFVLTRSQLKSLIQEATAPILREIQDLRESISSIEARQDRDYERFAGDICDHGQRLRNLEKVKLQPLQRDRGEILRALLVANGGKMLAKEARLKMHMRKDQFSTLLKTCDFIETKPFHADKRKDIIILRSKLV
jgi:hypothetical protein